MVTVTYDTLNDLVHEVGESIERHIGLGKDILDLLRLNDTIVDYLANYGIQYEDELEDEDDGINVSAYAEEVRKALVYNFDDKTQALGALAALEQLAKKGQ